MSPPRDSGQDPEESIVSLVPIRTLVRFIQDKNTQLPHWPHAWPANDTRDLREAKVRGRPEEGVAAWGPIDSNACLHEAGVGHFGALWASFWFG